MSEPGASTSSTPFRLGLAAVALVVFVVAARSFGDNLPAIATGVKALGAWGPIAFVLAYALAVVGFVPGSILTLAGGALFGIAWGTVYVFIAAVLGSAAAFLIARYLARDRVAHRIGANPRFEAIDRAVGEQGLRIVFLLRLSPAFPFSLMNYALGLTRIGFRDYLVASIGMLPGTLLYVYSGKAAGDVATLAAGAAVDRSPAYYAVLALGLVATLAVTTIVTRLARKALQEHAALAAEDTDEPTTRQE